jgi:[ribosomal protein S5]-alanine N-acetyltransferase
MFQILTQRLALRPFTLQEGEALMRVFGDAQVMRFGDGPQSRAWVEDWLRACQEHYAARGYGPYAVTEQRTGELLGYCGLTYFPDVNGRSEVELGYRLARAAWGQGYATEAALAVRDAAFSSLKLQRLVSIIDPGNTASIRVAEKLGMRCEAEVMFPGYDHPDHVYATNFSPAGA